MYTVREIFYTLQGEGANAGRAAVFCRFSGCNLWTGREADRHRAVCQFCDTDFVIRSRLRKPLSRMIIEGSLQPHMTVKLDVDAGGTLQWHTGAQEV